MAAASQGKCHCPHAGHRLGGLGTGDSGTCHEAEGALGTARAQMKLIKEVNGGSQAAEQPQHLEH